MAMRVSQGGHDIPPEKLVSRFPRLMANLKAAVRELPFVVIFDNDGLITPFRRVAVIQDGRVVCVGTAMWAWRPSLE